MGLVARIVAWLSANQDDLYIVASLAALCVLVRVLWLTDIETWGDAAQKWHFVRQWFHHNSFGHGATWTHHMARFGVNVPLFFVQLLLGRTVSVYYVLPVAAYAVTSVLVYVIGKRLAGRGAGILCALFFIFFRGMIRSSSQLLPDGIACVPLLLVAYCLIRLEESQGRKRMRWLVGASLAFVGVYMTKESNLLFAPAALGLVWLSRKSLKESAIFCAILGAVLVLETAGYALFTDYSSRMAIVQEAHGELSVSFLELFDRFLTLEPAWQMLFWLWVPSVLWLAGSSDKRLRPIVVLPMVFVLLLTFMVRRVDPIVLWVSFKSRYFAAVAPFWVLASGLAVAEAVRRIWATHAPTGWHAVPAHFARHAATWMLALSIALGVGTYFVAGGSSPIARERHRASILNDAYRRNLPLIEYASRPRGLKTLYSIHLNDKYLVQARAATDGRLPNLDQAIHFARRSENYAYLLRDPEAYKRGELKKLIRAGCVIKITPRGSLRLSTDAKLPEHCKAPRGEPIPR